MVWPTCTCRRSSACSASGVPLKFCRPLSMPPMRVPRPPASTRPVMSSAVMFILLESATDVAHLDSARARRGAVVRGALAAQFGIAVGPALPDVADGGGDLLVAGAFLAQQRAQVVAGVGKEA